MGVSRNVASILTQWIVQAMNTERRIFLIKIKQMGSLLVPLYTMRIQKGAYTYSVSHESIRPISHGKCY